MKQADFTISFNYNGKRHHVHMDGSEIQKLHVSFIEFLEKKEILFEQEIEPLTFLSVTGDEAR